MHEIPYQIYLPHGETFLVDWEEAYEAYKAVCIRKKVPFVTRLVYLNKPKLVIDEIVFLPQSPVESKM